MKQSPIRNPLLVSGAMFAIALSLSIGWGIRGNFGHESGAMIAGALSAIAVAALSAREDWRSRTAYFALFGALGWGFGGSIAYMYPLAFTESGHTASTYYGYLSLFLEGGLWCGMGAAGTALAAAMPLNRLTRMFVPLCFVLAAMGLRHFVESPLENLLATAGSGTGDATWHRHESPLYWLDADWLPAIMALIGVCIFDLFHREPLLRKRVIDHPSFSLLFLAGGGMLGYLLQSILRAVGWEVPLRNALVVKLGDLTYVHPQSGKPFDPDQLLTNWPQFFSDYPQHLGWGLGILGGGAVYFWLTGQFRKDASLFVYLSLGWLLAFLALPVLGSTVLMEYGGCRLMPPRSDDWAGVLGVFVAGILWSRRNGLIGVSHVMSMGFIGGGISFASVPMLRYLLRYPGHPWRFPEGVPESFQHYQSANWHSILEQMHGFGHGIAIAVAMAMLWRRQPPEPRVQKTGGWTVAFSVLFVLFGVGFLNLHKLVETWVGNGSVPPVLKAPLIGSIEWSALTWFSIVWFTATATGAVLVVIHQRRRLDLVPATWLGKGQLLFVLFLWTMVIGNLLRAIPGFSNSRMVTEWVLFMNASLATLLIAVLPAPAVAESAWATPRDWGSLGARWARGLAGSVVLLCVYGFLTLAIYHKHLQDKPWANHRRFGSDAIWRVEPILKHGEHP